MRTWAEITDKQRSSYDACPHCGGPKSKHGKSCQACSQNYKKGAEHYAWKGDAANSVVKRRRAANPKVWGPCELCGAKGVDRHHKDGNPGNNVPENLQVLCRRCHMKVDGRLGRLAAMNLPIRVPPLPCVICGALAKPRRKGRCAKCREYWRRNGIERPATLTTSRRWSLDEARDLLTAGLSQRETARRLGISHTVLHTTLKREAA